MAAAVETFVPEPATKAARKSAASAAEVALPSFVEPAKRGKLPIYALLALLVLGALGFGGWKWMKSRAAAKQAAANAALSQPVAQPVAAPPAAEQQSTVTTTAGPKPNAPKPGTANANPTQNPAKPDKPAKPNANDVQAPVMAVSAGGNSRKRDDQEVAPPTVNVGVSNGLPSGLMSTAAVIPGKPVAVSTGAQEGRLIHRVEPHYPEIAKRSGRGGTVRLAVTIGTDGKVKKVRILEGSPILAGAAQDAVMQWRYRPYMLDGKPTEVETEVTVKFENPR